MPPARNRTRPITDENDENAGSQRLTRAKAAGKGIALDNINVDMGKKPLQRSKSNISTTTSKGAQPRKRAALGDVSNVAKNEAPAERNTKDAKKPLAEKGLVSKAAQPTRVQKVSRQASTRSILSSKDKNTAASDLKRPASGSGIAGHATKKRHTASSSSSKSVVQETLQEDENVEPPSKKTTVEVTKTVKVEKDVVEEEIEAKLIEEVAEKDEMIPDLDADDHDDPLMVSEYVGEIFEYLRELEQTTMANPDYIDNQPELEWKMRGILVDWLLEVHTRFRLLPETMFLAVNIIDRFLSCKVVQLDKLQLVGITAMFIASKYEEVLSPHVQNFRHVTGDDGFTEQDILDAERFILSTLDYDLSHPNPMNFLRRISKADNYDINTRTLGKYLLEIGCLDYRFMQYPSSQIAAAAMYFARLVLEKGEWDPTLAHYAGYSEEQIRPVLELMIDYLHGPVAHEAFFKKYASKKFMKASILLRQWVKEHHDEYVS
ncbi:A/B/D/E cyclin [Rhizodiscina lignyota]|uniref:A/B/D/E cyclin n=1 Tax=Rhizodiscina lignyota TaxID=1504668 RepID=A0A9P4I5K6_9PEZI|nr:A/B/D/E cyclin [Rhizodiscina lignyota]